MIHGGADEFVARWVIDRLGEPDYVIPPDFGHYKAFAVTIRDRLVAGVVYHGWSPANRNIMISMAAESPRWATKGNIQTLLRIPFEAFDCNRITAAIRENNHRSRKLTEGLGFKLDCILRGTQLALYGMTKDDYSQLREKFRVLKDERWWRQRRRQQSQEQGCSADSGAAAGLRSRECLSAGGPEQHESGYAIRYDQLLADCRHWSLQRNADQLYGDDDLIA